jgi:hypothetical protein
MIRGRRAARSPEGGACRPSLVQELVLDAILLRGDAAVDAWAELQRICDIDSLDPASLQIMPLVYWNLVHHGFDDALMAKLKGTYRMAWSRNQWLVSRSLPALRMLNEGGIPTMLLKGAALNLLYGEQHGIRLIGDVDVLVPKGDAQRAAAMLDGLGWTPKDGRVRVSDEFISVSKGLNLAEPGGGELDLHWHLFPEDVVPAHEDPVWRHAIPLPTAEVPTLVPSPTELLLHVCVHGWAWNPHPPFRWVVDAMTILRASSAGIDWDRLIEETRRRRLVLRLEAALTYLRERFDADVPDRVLYALRTAPVSRGDRFEYRLRTRPVRTPIGGLILHTLRFSRLRRVGGLQSGLLGFAEYLRRQWGLRHAGQVPLRMGGKLARRLGRSICRFIRGRHAHPLRVKEAPRGDRR